MSEEKKLLGTIFVRCRRLSIFFCFHIIVGFLLLKLYFMLIEFRMRANDSAITCFHSLVTLAIIGPVILLYSESFHNTYCKQLTKQLLKILRLVHLVCPFLCWCIHGMCSQGCPFLVKFHYGRHSK